MSAEIVNNEQLAEAWPELHQEVLDKLKVIHGDGISRYYLKYQVVDRQPTGVIEVEIDLTQAVVEKDVHMQRVENHMRCPHNDVGFCAQCLRDQREAFDRWDSANASVPDE